MITCGECGVVIETDDSELEEDTELYCIECKLDMYYEELRMEISEDARRGN